MGGSQSKSGKPLAVEQQEAMLSSINREKGRGNSEMFMPHNGPAIPMSLLLQGAKAACKVINNDGRGSGFLVAFPATFAGAEIRGLMTNNHVLGANRLAAGQKILLQFTRFDNTSFQEEFQIQPSAMRFTCPLLDFTFIEFSHAFATQLVTTQQLTFLTCSERAAVGQRVHILQHPRGQALCFASGSIRRHWGSDLFHDVTTDYGSSGSMILNNNGEVVGLHRARRVQDKVNVGVDLQHIRLAITMLYRQWRELPVQSCIVAPFHASILTDEQLAELQSLGLKPAFPGSQYLFESPPSFLVTALWFYRTGHAWYWTPTKPHQLENIDDVRQCNWMRIHRNCSLKVVGGFWQGQIPASRNVTLIHNLIASESRFL